MHQANQANQVSRGLLADTFQLHSKNKTHKKNKNILHYFSFYQNG